MLERDHMVAVAVHGDDFRQAITVDIAGRKLRPRRHEIGSTGREQFPAIVTADGLDFASELIADSFDGYDDVRDIVGVDRTVTVVVRQVEDDRRRVRLAARQRLKLLRHRERWRRHIGGTEHAPLREAVREDPAARSGGRVADVSHAGQLREVQRESVRRGRKSRRFIDHAAVEQNRAVGIERGERPRTIHAIGTVEAVGAPVRIARDELGGRHINRERHLDEATRVAVRVPVGWRVVNQALGRIAAEDAVRGHRRREQLHEIRLVESLTSDQACANHLELGDRRGERIGRSHRRPEADAANTGETRQGQRRVEDGVGDLDRAAVVKHDARRGFELKNRHCRF